MLEALASIAEVRVKNQQITDSDLTKVEKHDLLKNIFLSNPMHFLCRFGQHLELKQLDCFEELGKNDPNLAFYVGVLKKNNSSRKLRFNHV
jgi:hypothetical protein